jgi:hypothetical protein
MREPKKTYVGAAGFFERPADDGSPEDARVWPTGGCTSPPNEPSYTRVPDVRWFTFPRLFNRLLWNQNRR